MAWFSGVSGIEMPVPSTIFTSRPASSCSALVTRRSSVQAI